MPDHPTAAPPPLVLVDAPATTCDLPTNGQPPSVAAVAAPIQSTAAAPDACLARLTPRELVVFQLLAVGKYNKEVAADLGIALGTAKKHRENLQRKLDCHSRGALARMALRAAEPSPEALASRYDGGTARAVPWSLAPSGSQKR